VEFGGQNAFIETARRDSKKKNIYFEYAGGKPSTQRKTYHNMVLRLTIPVRKKNLLLN